MSEEVKAEDKTEVKNELTEGQRSILDKVIARKDSSTGVLCTDDEQDARLRLLNAYITKHANEKDSKTFQDAEKEVFEIYKNNLYDVYSGKLMKVEGSLEKMTWTSEDEGAKKEIADKAAIEGQKKALEKELYKIQTAATNKAIAIYKEHYKDIVARRQKAFEEMDNSIFNAKEL